MAIKRKDVGMEIFRKVYTAARDAVWRNPTPQMTKFLDVDDEVPQKSLQLQSLATQRGRSPKLPKNTPQLEEQTWEQRNS